MERKKFTHEYTSNLPFLCCICGDKARGMNFSVLSCVSCKSFFRRHGLLNIETLRCRRQGKCVITIVTRGNCLPCRLQKCKDSGMDPLKIRGPTKTQANFNSTYQSIITTDRQIQLITPKPLNLLRTDSSTLTSAEWNLLSNMIGSFNEQDLNNRVKNLLAERSSLPPKLRLKPSDTIDFLSGTYKTILPLMKRSPHLRSLSSYAYRILLTHNLVYTAALNGYFVAYETDSFRHPTYMSACNALFGSDFMMKYAQDNTRLVPNGNLYKLMLFVLIFSSNCSVVLFTNEDELESNSCTIELIRIQNIYATIIWKYLVYIYGYNGAAIQFSRIIKNILDMFARIEELLTNLTFKKLIDKIAEQAEHSLIIMN